MWKAFHILPTYQQTEESVGKQLGSAFSYIKRMYQQLYVYC